MGKFHDDEMDEFFEDKSSGLNSQIKVEEAKPLSKHAARRKKKKAAAAMVSQGPIMDDNEPSLNDL